MTHVDEDVDYDALLDGDRYPTDYALELVSDFPGTPRDLVEFIRDSLWYYHDFVSVKAPWRGNIEVKFVTGGWSGNESVLTALSESFFHFRFWESSHRGGLHMYSIPVHDWESKTLIGKLPSETSQVI